MKPKSDAITISVIMAVKNGGAYLENAIKSILCQTFGDFEFIIINDASTDNTEKIIKSVQDERIVLLTNEKNIGLTKSLNIGLETARGKYIARMDADDISLEDRFQKQYQYLEEHPEVYLLSCSYREFGTRFYTNRINLSSQEIQGQYLFGSVLPHPGFMFRRELIEQYEYFYDPEIRYAQDYDFQFRVSTRFKVACLADVLIRYRVSNNQISSQKVEEQRCYANKTRKKVYDFYGIACSANQIDTLAKIYSGDRNISKKNAIGVISLLKEINKKTKQTPYYEYINKKVLEYLQIANMLLFTI